jgi:hypothetical protein
MATRFSALFGVLLVAACISMPKSGVDHKTMQRTVAGDVGRVCALPPNERQSEIERIRSQEGIAIVCPND